MADSVKIKIDGDDSGFKSKLSGIAKTAGNVVAGAGKILGAGLAAKSLLGRVRRG